MAFFLNFDFQKNHESSDHPQFSKGFLHTLFQLSLKVLLVKQIWNHNLNAIDKVREVLLRSLRALSEGPKQVHIVLWFLVESLNDVFCAWITHITLYHILPLFIPFSKETDIISHKNNTSLLPLWRLENSSTLFQNNVF